MNEKLTNLTKKPFDVIQSDFGPFLNVLIALKKLWGVRLFNFDTKKGIFDKILPIILKLKALTFVNRSSDKKVHNKSIAILYLA